MPITNYQTRSMISYQKLKNGTNNSYCKDLLLRQTFFLLNHLEQAILLLVTNKFFPLLLLALNQRKAEVSDLLLLKFKDVVHSIFALTAAVIHIKSEIAKRSQIYQKPHNHITL